MRWQSISVLACIALGCQACLTPYKIAKGEKTAQLTALTDAPNICVNGRAYSIQKERGKRYSVIPAEQRVTIYESITVDSYPMTYYCTASVSFVPIEGASYITDINEVGQRCRIELVLESSFTINGLDNVLSLGPSTCGAK